MVIGNFNKHYNKWFLMSQKDKEALAWEENKKKKVVRLHVRKIIIDPLTGLWKHVAVVDGSTGSTANDVFKQVGVKEVVEVRGKLTLFEED